MYNPASFSENRPDVLAAAIAGFPLANLVTLSRDGRIDASAIPLLLQSRDNGALVLRGHMARANPQWNSCLEASEALAIFSGPQQYISPSWYPSKAEHGRVVPTWNYVVVHARGPLHFHPEPEWLLRNVTALTQHQESPREDPWHVTDAPPAFIEGQLKAIIGIELEITQLEGKWKVSQNRTETDRRGVLAALDSTSGQAAQAMAALIRQTLPD